MDTGKKQTGNETSARNDDYLWDGSGEPDPEIQRLEVLLGRFHHDRPVPVFPEIVPDGRWTLFPWRLRLFPALATAGTMVAIAVVIFLMYGRKPIPVTVAG